MSTLPVRTQPGKEIAVKIKINAGIARSLAQELRLNKSKLDSSWDGVSKGYFMSELGPLISRLESYASWLEDQAREIEAIEVVEIPGQNGEGSW